MRLTGLRGSEKLSAQEWSAFETEGYVRLGTVPTADGLEALCNRIDAIMRGEIRYEKMEMQLCPSVSGVPHDSMDCTGLRPGSIGYRKLTQLELDPVFLNYIQHPLFRSITRKKIGEKVGLFRAMFFNKPANAGVHLDWHQDGRYWNLSIKEEFTVYTALDAQTPENGCLTVVPRSHLDATTPHTVKSPENILRYAPETRRLPLSLAPGEVVLFKTALLHSSADNRTQRPRRALSLSFIHADAYDTKSGARYPQVFPQYVPAQAPDPGLVHA